MANDDERLTEVFFDVQRGLPRQGIGSEESTLRALGFCTDLPVEHEVLDVGCGPGMQTVALAGALDGRITAVDLHEEFLEELRARAVAAGVIDRITILRASMDDLPFEPGSFDLIWCEGAAYIMGVPESLASWHRLLRRAGYVAFSELVWTMADPPAEVVDLFQPGYPSMTDVEGTLARIHEAGYDVIGHFLLPESAWWEDYLAPLEAKLPGLSARYAGDKEALAIVDTTRQEIELRRRFPDAYGYAFFIGRRPS